MTVPSHHQLLYVPDQAAIDRYYRSQSGRGIDEVYAGRRLQRGYGIGSILGSVFRIAAPILRFLAPRALSFGSRVLSDVVDQGAPLKETLQRRGREALERGADDFAKGLAAAPQSGSGRRIRRSRPAMAQSGGVMTRSRKRLAASRAINIKRVKKNHGQFA